MNGLATTFDPSGHNLLRTRYAFYDPGTHDLCNEYAISTRPPCYLVSLHFLDVDSLVKKKNTQFKQINFVKIKFNNTKHYNARSQTIRLLYNVFVVFCELVKHLDRMNCVCRTTMVGRESRTSRNGVHYCAWILCIEKRDDA